MLSAKEKNRLLIKQLSNKRGEFCGLGTRGIKCLLNTLSKTNILAKVFRVALEIEDLNIQAKKNYYYKEEIYFHKSEKIDELIELCKKNNIVYGIQDSDVFDTNSIIYFELPECEQISFHNNFKRNRTDLPKYEKEWDGKINTTLPKIEEALLKQFPNEIEKKIQEKLKKESKKVAKLGK